MQESSPRDLCGGESVLSDAGIPSRDCEIADNISSAVYSAISTEKVSGFRKYVIVYHLVQVFLLFCLNPYFQVSSAKYLENK